MPELPEVETVRRGLAGLILHRQITKVTGLCDKSLQIAPADVSRLVTGATVAGVRRRAKMLMIDLTSGYTLLIHLKMTGQLVYRGDQAWAAGHPNDSMIGELPDKSTRVIFELFGGGKLFFNDQRKFGWIKLYPTGEVMQLAGIVKLAGASVGRPVAGVFTTVASASEITDQDGYPEPDSAGRCR